MTQGEWGFHGDVIVEKVTNIPTGLKPVKTGILAEGEMTGHAHRVDLNDVDVFSDAQGNLYTIPKTDEGFTITHEEHRAVTVPLKTGEVGRVIIQKEYDHFAEEARRVAD